MKNRCMSTSSRRNKTLTTLESMKKKGRSFYEFLIHLWKHHHINDGSNPGSCTNPRFQTTGCTTNWGHLSEKIFDLCRNFYTSDSTLKSEKAMKKCISELCHTLVNSTDQNKKKQFNGAGSFTTGAFVQVLSLLGVIPLYCFTYGEIIGPKQGSAKFIKIGMKNPKLKASECNEILQNIHKDFTSIWGSLITLALLENMFCELFRSYSATVKEYKKNNIPLPANHPYDIMYLPNVEPSPKVDIFFEDLPRRCVENSYLLRMSGSKCDHLKPILCMKHTEYVLQNNGNNEFKLTNWLQNSTDPMLLSWSESNRDLKLHSKLVVHEDLRDILTLH